MAHPVESAIRAGVAKGLGVVASVNRAMMKADAPNPYLHGLFAPVAEEVTHENLEVIGDIPPELEGTYLRNGPNPVTPPKNEAAYHWFTGEGMVHGVRLRGGKALWYKNRWIRSNAVSDALSEPRAPGPRGMFDSPNTNVIGHAGATWAIVEAGGFPVRLDGDLNTVAHDPFGGTLKNAFSAHPHMDPDTGELHAICYRGSDAATIWHVVVDRSGKVRREAPIRVQDGPSIHDCMITRSYVIILDLPVTFSMKQLIAGHAFPYKWNPAHRARVGLLPRDGGNDDVIWCDVDPCYVFHPANAYETPDGKVVLDACVHAEMFAESAMGPDSHSVPFERWTIDPVARRVERKVLDADPQEFPRPNEARTGKAYRYAYTLALQPNPENALVAASRLYKHDLETGARQTHDFGEGRSAGEFVFTPKAGATAEDDGWLMGYVTDADLAGAELVILDAKRFEAAPQARIKIPSRVPAGFHGNWVAAAANGS